MSKYSRKDADKALEHYMKFVDNGYLRSTHKITVREMSYYVDHLINGMKYKDMMDKYGYSSEIIRGHTNKAVYKMDSFVLSINRVYNTYNSLMDEGDEAILAAYIDNRLFTRNLLDAVIKAHDDITRYIPERTSMSYYFSDPNTCID